MPDQERSWGGIAGVIERLEDCGVTGGGAHVDFAGLHVGLDFNTVIDGLEGLR